MGFKHLSVGLFLVIMVGCTSKPYHPYHIDKPTSQSFLGIHPASHGVKESSVVMIHGMCHQSDTWFFNAGQSLAKQLNMTISFDSDYPNGEIFNSASHGVQAYKIVFKKEDYKVNFYGIRYSDATLKQKQTYLCRDMTKEYKPASMFCSKDELTYSRKRAEINAKVKNLLLNDCLADAVIYLGKTGLQIKAGVRLALNSIYDDQMKVNSTRPIPLSLISVSLGSKVLRDALLPDTTVKMSKGLQLVSRATHVYLSANQIPLLNLGNNHTKKMKTTIGIQSTMPLKGDFSDVVNLINQIRREKTTRLFSAQLPDALKVISFTDPNDLLSYEIIKKNYGNNNVVNVIVSNGSTYDFKILPSFENPLDAHVGHLTNPGVLGLLACGFRHANQVACASIINKE